MKELSPVYLSVCLVDSREWILTEAADFAGGSLQIRAPRLHTMPAPRPVHPGSLRGQSWEGPGWAERSPESQSWETVEPVKRRTFYKLRSCMDAKGYYEAAGKEGDPTDAQCGKPH